MKIIISIQNKKIRIILKKGKKEIVAAKIEEERNFSEKLLFEIDKILKKKLQRGEKIPKIEVKSDQNNNFTTTRIARTAARVWNGA